MQMQVTVLSISPFTRDHAALADILQPYSWQVHRTSTLAGARRLLRSHSVSLIVCERDLPPYSWKDLFVNLVPAPRNPLVIVTSCHADDHMWAEALNLGAYDVLAKPFDPAEVRRSLSFAALHWQRNQASALPPLVMAAGA